MLTVHCGLQVPATKYGMALCTIDGQQWGAGDCDEHFCIQSCSKVVTYLVAQARAEGFDVKA